MKKISLFVCFLVTILAAASDSYYYADDQRVRLFERGYSEVYRAQLYATSPSSHSKMMFAPDRIIVCLDTNLASIDKLADKYGLKLLRRMPVSGSFYLFATPHAEAIAISNKIVEQEPSASCAYPDWQYVR